MDKNEYKNMTDRKTPASKTLRNSLCAFLTGGTICTVGQALSEFYKGIGLEGNSASSAVSITLILIGVLLTGLDIYPKIAKFAGAGTIVPITGFANSVAAPAIESRTEGFVLGVGAKMFAIAGPVIVFGIGSSFIAGLCYWVSMFW